MAKRFILPPEAHVGAVTLQVSDVARSSRFYVEMLGFEILHGAERDGAKASLGARDGGAPLLHLHEQRGARPVPRRGLLGLYHFAILLPRRQDLGSFFSHALRAGLQVSAADHLFSEALYLVDPDGITVEVYRDRPRDQWVRHDGELVAASDPLDTDGLIAAGSGLEWHGLPPATTIGHVHFYVGDLPRARAFYVDALGFEPMIASFPGALFVSAGGYHHHVGLNTWASASPVAGDDDARLLYWDLVLPNETALRQTALGLSAAGQETAEQHDGRVARDPWGIAVRLTHRP
ncbi:MAG: VOC family protein [Vicinamibacterales bacterium]